MVITLDDFFAQTAELPLLNLAAQLGTTRTTRADSIWQNDVYGGALETLLGRKANTTSLQIEIERSMGVVGVSGTVELGPDSATVFIERATLTVRL